MEGRSWVCGQQQVSGHVVGGSFLTPQPYIPSGHPELFCYLLLRPVSPRDQQPPCIYVPQLGVVVAAFRPWEGPGWRQSRQLVRI